MSHRTRVLRTTEGWVGLCSCGYRTDTKNTRETAAVVVNTHEVAQTTPTETAPGRKN